MNKEKYIEQHCLEKAPHLKDFSTEYYIDPYGNLYTWNLVRGGFHKHPLTFKQYVPFIYECKPNPKITQCVLFQVPHEQERPGGHRGEHVHKFLRGPVGVGRGVDGV